MAKQSEATLLLRIKEIGSEAISKTANALGTLKDFALAAYAEIAAGVGIALKAWHEQEKATNTLNQSLINQGIYTKELSKSYQDMATELARSTLYADDAIVASQAILQNYLGEIPVTKELMKATLDLATAKGIDLASAAEAVGKSIGTSTNALARQGIEVNAAIPKAEKLAQVTDTLNKKFGGQAEAATSGLGALEQMRKEIGEVAEVIGERLAPTFIKGANAIRQFAIDLQSNTQFLEGFVTVVEGAVKGGSFLKMVFVDLGQTIGQILGSAVGGISQLFEGKWKESWETFKNIPTDSAKIVKDNYENFQRELVAIDDAFTQDRNAKEEENIALAQKSANRKVEIEREKHSLMAADYDQAKINEQIKENEYALIKQDTELARQLSTINSKLANETDYVNKLALLRQKEQLIEDANNKAKAAGAEAYTKFKIYLSTQEGQAVTNTLNSVSSLQNSKSKELAAVGKAAAIAQATINTYLGITQALAHLPPPFSFVAAAAIGTAGFAQVANIAGVQLAEGGIVKATPGGINATIGEGGRDEAVIPLDSPEAAGRLGGGGTTIHFNGPVMGDQSQAREFAIAIDRELYRLRRDGQAISYDAKVN